MRKFKPTKQNFEDFGRFMYDMIYNRDQWFSEEWSEDVMPRAVLAGLAEQVPYDPMMHGVVDEAEPGDEVWVWRQAIYPRKEWAGEK